MVPVSQMSWQQVKQGFIGSYYQTCVGYPDWHSRPSFVQDFLYCFSATTGRNVLGAWLAASIQLLTHCLYTPWDVISCTRCFSSRVKGTSNCLQTILYTELTQSAITLVSSLISSPQCWLMTKGPVASGNAKVAKGFPPLYPTLVGEHQGAPPSVQITILQDTDEEYLKRYNSQVPWRFQGRQREIQGWRIEEVSETTTPSLWLEDNVLVAIKQLKGK